MTRQDVESIPYYEQKIIRLKDALEDLTQRLTSVGSPASDGMPHSSRVGMPTEAAAEKLYEKSREVRELILLTDQRRDEVREWIETLDREDIKQIIFLKYIKNQTWTQVAHAMHYADASAPFKKYNRFWQSRK